MKVAANRLGRRAIASDWQSRNRRLEHPIYNRLARVLWIGIVMLVVLLAMYVSVGRMVAANMSGYRTVILRELNERMPFTVEARQVRGEWRAFSPVIILTQLRISLPAGSSPPLALSEGRMEVDVLHSLRTRSLQMRRLVLKGLSLRGEFSGSGQLRLTGFGNGSGGSTAALREFLLNVESIVLRDNRLLLTMPDGEARDLALDLTLAREGSERRVQATLTSTAGARITVLAEGMGDPFRPAQFWGRAYFDIRSTNLGAVRDLLVATSPPAWADGAADLELWLTWDRGRPMLQARLEGRDLVVAPPGAAWQLSLQRVALEAQWRRDAGRWMLFVSNLQVEEGGVATVLPRLQVERRDSGVALRAADVPLDALGEILARQEGVPDALRESCAALRPRGRLPLLQAHVADLAHPARDWGLEATFADVAVDSWHGAPGVTAASGHARIAPGGAHVILDSRALSLAFPEIYRAPLQFEELHGSLDIDWDAEAVRLHSGLLTALGDEGTTKVLFGLNIPLQASDVGIEMDLLVGLQDSHAKYREKYIPYVLDPALLSWLADSIGDGSIAQGAFLWRGSLRANSTPLHTVQLAFNVADTQMTYHPRWPPVLVQQGTVLINDSAVSVWAARARLFDSAVERLSVETRVDAHEQITLNVSGKLHGPASDGFKVLNESALSGVVGTAFADWTASGHLDTELYLQLNLSDASAAPRVEVATRWRDVDLLVMPGNLPLQRVNGDFGYSTTRGFSSRALTGVLWGEELHAEIQQQPAVQAKGYEPGVTVVDVELAADVEMADLREWLQLDFLAFARGKTAADARIRLSPGSPPVLMVDSDLAGVSLDLPQPWNKTAQESRPLRIAVPLARGTLPLSLSLAPQLDMHLDIADSAVQGGALGLGVAAGESREGELRVSGRVPLVRVNEWLEFAERYAGANLADALTPAAAAGAIEPRGEPPRRAADDGRAPLGLAIDDVRIDSLVLLEQELHDVAFSLVAGSAQWSASVDTDWLRANLSAGQQGAAPRLAIEHLDLDRVPDFGAQGDRGESLRELPPVSVEIANIVQSRGRLGHLQFELQGHDGEFVARNISGELAHLRLPAENAALVAWRRGESPSTDVKASLHFADLGKTLAFFGYESIVQTELGQFDIDLHWPGAPQDFSLAAAQGSMQVSIGHGNFLEATAGATGALRVVSILNLADIVRRLSLSNMFESGIPFDSVSGEISLRSGTLKVANMDVKGGSSFQFSGTSDVAAKTIDAQMVATLPVASNLPWIAALAASLPVAAGVYVISEVFDQQMNRLTSAVYAITGTWQEPEVSFDRIFDDTAQPAVDSPPDDQPPP